MTRAPATRVILVDDHHLVRRGLAALMQMEGDYHIVAEAADGEAALQTAAATPADLMILDLSMPRLNGLETTRRLKRRLPALKILILSMYNDPEFVAQALRAGADGYILKQSLEDELFLALDALAAGERFVSPTIDDLVAEAHQPASMATLTPREQEILHLIVDGRTTVEIAARLSISPHTVSRHRANLMQKLAVHNQAELVRVALERRLVVPRDPPPSMTG